MYQINDDVEMQNAGWEQGLISQLAAHVTEPHLTVLPTNMQYMHDGD